MVTIDYLLQGFMGTGLFHYSPASTIDKTKTYIEMY